MSKNSLINKNYGSINMREKSEYLSQNIPKSPIPHLSFTRIKQPYYLWGIAKVDREAMVAPSMSLP